MAEQMQTLLSEHDIEILRSFDEGADGYFGKMLQYLEDFIEQGIAEGRFTEQEAKEDLQIALWYSFACNNIDEYIFYYKAAEWMPFSEKNAKGCATWYYRYSCALMYCGQLEKAREYAERGAAEEPEYPWIWLQVGKLRKHFQDREGALAAAAKGLQLVPDDYEFLNLRREIMEDASLERMIFHWINPEFDKELQAGKDENFDFKYRTISCVVLRPDKLEQVKSLFRFSSWKTDGPYCSGIYQLPGRTVEFVFAMNEAGVSNMNYYWLKLQKASADSGSWNEYRLEDGSTGSLAMVVFSLNYEVSLFYNLPGSDRYFRIDITNEPAGSNENLN